MVGKSEEEILALADSGQASSRRWGYTGGEEETMLTYIISNKEYYRVGGNDLWQEMKEKKILEGRSWRSMKDHFLTIVMTKLEGFPFLTEEQRSFLRERTVVKDREGKVTAGQVRAGLPYTKEEDAAMLSFIDANQGYAKPGGGKLWKKMEEEGILEGRTWRSMKMHYLQTLKKKKLSSVEDKEKEEEEEMEVDESETEDNEEEVDDVDEESCIIVNFQI